MPDRHFYYSTLRDGEHLTLDRSESSHCIRVMRHRRKDRIEVLDGKGNIYQCIVEKPDPEKTIVKIEQVNTPDPLRNYKLHVGIGALKNMNRFEFFLEKATELGIDRITPLVSRYSEKTHLRPERLNKLLISALKQSEQYLLPVLEPLQTFDLFLKENQQGELFIAHGPGPSFPLLSDYKISDNNITILIGPEGGFHDEEVNQAIRMNYKAVSLGPSRLRTETAGIAAVSAVRFIMTGMDSSGRR